MSISDFYTLIGQLYTNKIICDSFFENPHKIMSYYNLNDYEIETLLQLNQIKLECFKQLLKEKNRRIAEKQFSLLFHHYKSEFIQLYDKAYELLPRMMHESDIDYSLRLGTLFLEMLINYDLPDYCADLIKFITNRLKCISKNFPIYNIKSKKYSQRSKPTLYPTIIYEIYEYKIEEIMLFISCTAYKPEKAKNHSIMYYLNGKTHFSILDNTLSDIFNLCVKGCEVREILAALKLQKGYSDNEISYIEQTLLPDLKKKNWIYYR